MIVSSNLLGLHFEVAIATGKMTFPDSAFPAGGDSPARRQATLPALEAGKAALDSGFSGLTQNSVWLLRRPDLQACSQGLNSQVRPGVCLPSAACKHTLGRPWGRKLWGVRMHEGVA